jgi:UDP-glucose 4-epimerase
MARYLVTGGAGFIGSNTCLRLLERGEEVVVVDNFSTGRRENIAPFLNEITLVECDIRDRERMERVVRGMDYVIHLAALPSVQRSVEDPLTSNDVNINGTLNLLVAARDNGVRQFVFASSSAVYGEKPRLPKTERMIPSPLSPYALSKLTGEYYCQIFNQLYGLKFVALRYFNVFGPRQDPGSEYAAVIPRFITALLREEPPIVFGDGEQSRDFTFVENVVDANCRACQSEAAAGNIMNIAVGSRISLNQLLDRLRVIMGTDIEAVYDAPRPGDIRHSFADISRAKRFLGYSPAIEIEEGLKKTIDWFSHVP